MGLLTNLLSWANQFQRGQAGLKEEVELQTLQEKLAALKRAAALAEKPVWSALPSGYKYDPAAGDIPPPPSKVGPTYGELGALAEITGKLPISTLISQKAGPEMTRPWLEKLMPPETVEQTLGGVMYPTKGLRELQQYLGVAGEIEKAKGVLPEQKKGLTDIAETIFGITEKRKRPTEYTLAPGQKRFIEGREIAGIPPKKEAYTLGPGQKRFEEGREVAGVPPKEEKPKLEAGYAAWKEHHPEGTYLDYKRDLKRISLMEAAPSIEDLSDQVRKWISLEKTIAMGGLGDEKLLLMMSLLPEDNPAKKAWKAQDLSALEAEARKQREYYQGLLEEARTKKEYPNAERDEYGNWVVTIEGKEYVISP